MSNRLQRPRGGLLGSRHAPPLSRFAPDGSDNDGDGSSRSSGSGWRGTGRFGGHQRRTGPRQRGNQVRIRQGDSSPSKSRRHVRDADQYEREEDMAAQARESKTLPSRLRPAQIDSLAEIGLLSKGDNRLLDYSEQEFYFQKIVHRYETLYGKFPLPGHQVTGDTGIKGEPLVEGEPKLFSNEPPQKSFVNTPRQMALQSASGGQSGLLITAMRGLREGLLASRRLDVFTVRAYVFIVRAGIYGELGFETYVPALTQLLDRVHMSCSRESRADRSGQTRSVEEEFLEDDGPLYLELIAYKILDLTCRQKNFSEALEMLQRARLRGALVNSMTQVRRTVGALIGGNWIVFWKAHESADAFQRKLMGLAEHTMESHIVNCLSKTYLAASKEYVQSCTKQDVEVLIAKHRTNWTLDDKQVIIRHIPRR